MLDNLMIGLTAVLSGSHLFSMFIATIVGLILGVMPGLGPLAAMALLIPFTFTMDPLTAVLVLASISAAANCSGAFTSILLNVPGETTSAATCFDGHPMARQGKATIAIGISIGASFFAAVFGVLIVIAVVQPVADLALMFGPPEYFALAVLGIAFVASLSGGSLAKGLIMAMFGLWISTIGIDAVNGEPRFTFGFLQLQDGIDLVPVMVGIFAVTELISWIQERGTISQHGKLEGSVWGGVVETFRYPVTLVRSTMVGLTIGGVPGVGAVISSFLAYEVERWFGKSPERFGRGAPEGVIAPEAANNSSQCGSLAPALALGIPGGATSALLLVALTIHGIKPGPMLFSSEKTLVYGFLVGLIFGAAMFLITSVACARWLAKITLVRAELLAPVFLIVSFAGVYAQNQSFSDILVAIGFGLIGCVTKSMGFPPVPLILGVVLGRMLESSASQSLSISGGDWSIFVSRPLSGTLICIAAAMMLVPVYSGVRTYWAKSKSSTYERA
jgi:putative tricarboxylic transport membrane protein